MNVLHSSRTYYKEELKCSFFVTLSSFDCINSLHFSCSKDGNLSFRVIVGQFEMERKVEKLPVEEGRCQKVVMPLYFGHTKITP